MHYDEALKLAGAEVHAYRRFGSPMGHWWAKVTWQGTDSWAHGFFGACPNCDVIESEIGEFYHRHDGVEKRVDGRVSDFQEGCEDCQAMGRRLLLIAREHLDNLVDQQEAEFFAEKCPNRRIDREEMVEWIKANHI